MSTGWSGRCSPQPTCCRVCCWAANGPAISTLPSQATPGPLSQGLAAAETKTASAINAVRDELADKVIVVSQDVSMLSDTVSTLKVDAERADEGLGARIEALEKSQLDDIQSFAEVSSNLEAVGDKVAAAQLELDVVQQQLQQIRDENAQLKADLKASVAGSLDVAKAVSQLEEAAKCSFRGTFDPKMNACICHAGAAGSSCQFSPATSCKEVELQGKEEEGEYAILKVRGQEEACLTQAGERQASCAI